MPTDILIRNILVTGESRANTVVAQVTWTDGTLSPIYKAATGDRISSAYLTKINGLWQCNLDYQVAANKVVGPRKP